MMKKRLLSVILAVCMLCALLPVGLPMAQAYSSTDIAYPVEGGNLYFDKATGTISDCDDTVTAANIPAQIGGVAVTSIGDYAFAGCSNLASVTIPDGVTSIGEWAFWSCFSLTSAKLPNSVLSIGDSAFYYCSSLVRVTIPNNLTSIGDSVFYECSSLTRVTIPESVTSISAYAFEGCSSLQSVYFMGNAPALGQNAFQFWDDNTHGYINIPGLRLYYIEGKDGWTAPTWNGYPTATWDPDNNPVQPADDFTDVSKNQWYYSAVNFAVGNNLFLGTSDITFSPNEAMTRAMLVTVLWRLEGKPEAGTQTGFKDVPAGEYYAQPVAWAAANGIVMGTSDTTFSPNGKITREQMATILYRYAQKKGYDTTKSADLSKFPDNGKVSSYAQQALAWANAEGLINGDEQSNGTVLLDPAGNATRAQVAAILMRYVQNIVE